VNSPDEEVWAIAQRVCTPAQLEALEHKARGYSERSMARELGITRSAVQSRLEAAFLKIRREVARSTPE
jgi:DNA-directed RNA polymerase specialized sigma24 family protein